MKKTTGALDDTITEIGHRIDKLIDLCETEKILPKTILDEGFILRSMFPNGESSPLRTLTMTYIRLEPIIRFLEENLVPELQDRKSAPKAAKTEETTLNVAAKN